MLDVNKDTLQQYHEAAKREQCHTTKIPHPNNATPKQCHTQAKKKHQELRPNNERERRRKQMDAKRKDEMEQDGAHAFTRV